VPPDALVPVPLFPLSNVVLFPGVRAPLHVFEPRYRQMTRDALAGERLIGMIAVRPEHQGAMAGDPPLFEVGCLGTIVESEALPDGRYHVVLLGTSRFRVERERPRAEGRLYRVAEVEPLAETSTPVAPDLRTRLLASFARVVRAVAPDRAEELDASLFEGVDDPGLVHLLCQLLDLPPAEKQGLLESNGVSERGERLCAVLEFHAAEQAMRAPAGGETRH